MTSETSDLKAAAERLRRHRDAKICGDSPYYDAGLNLLRWYQIDQDTKITSLAYLATQQQDGGELDRVRMENSHLRASLALGSGPCVYCNLPAEEWGRCKAGFPGCGRADDATLCPHFGAQLQLDDCRQQIKQQDGRETQLIKAIDLIKRCYVAGHREGWHDGETNTEVFDAVNDFMTDMIGSDWIARMEAEAR